MVGNSEVTLAPGGILRNPVQFWKVINSGAVFTHFGEMRRRMPAPRLSGGGRSQLRTILSLLTAKLTANSRHFRHLAPAKSRRKASIFQSLVEKNR
jgi:hypothetical protein